MHVGEFIEGGVGSKYKIDALYLSPAITVCNRIQQLAEDTYRCPILLSEEFKHCLSQTAQMLTFTRPPPDDDIEGEPFNVSIQTLRIIDRVFLKSRGFPIDLYSFDIKTPVHEVLPPEGHQIGDIFVTAETAELHDMEKVYKYPLSYMFSVDEDVYSLQQHRVRQGNYSNQNDFYIEYNEAMEAYVDGEWEPAIEALDKCLAIDPEDGPSIELKRFMKNDNLQANSLVPEQWPGYRSVSFNFGKFDIDGL